MQSDSILTHWTFLSVLYLLCRSTDECSSRFPVSTIRPSNEIARADDIYLISEGRCQHQHRRDVCCMFSAAGTRAWNCPPTCSMSTGPRLLQGVKTHAEKFSMDCNCFVLLLVLEIVWLTNCRWWSSVVRTSLFGWRTFSALRIIYGWQLTSSCVKCPQVINQPGQLSLPTLQGW